MHLKVIPSVQLQRARVLGHTLASDIGLQAVQMRDGG
jgi:hypothetical protein